MAIPKWCGSVALVASSAFILAAVAAAPAAATIAGVDHADDVCPPSADPCVVDQRVEIVTGSTLDFGLRVVEVRDGGLLDAGAGVDVEVLCGTFTARTGDKPAVILGSPERSVTRPRLRIRARRACSDAPNVACHRDTDCTAGTCSVGSGTMEIDGRIVADGVKPGDATFRAAGDLTVRRAASADATHADSDGGILDFWSGEGSLLVGARLSVEGGARGGGGDIYIDAAHDVTVNAPISADGGDFDAGFVTSDTGGDVTINANVTARSVVGAGSGGIIDFAGRNVTVAEGVKILANGHRGEFGGDGGEIGFGASNDVIIHRNVVLSVRGARPDGYGGFFDIEADGNVSLAGLVRARGATGAGLVLVGAEGQTILTKDSRILADGKESGGEIDIYGAYVEVDGKVSGSARRRDGYSARVTLGSDGDVRVGGSIQMNGTSDTFGSGPLRVAGCNVELADGARVRHRGHMGEVEFEGRELIHLSPRARASARGDDGVVRFVHRDGGPAPLLEGRVSPAPVIQPDASLTACAP